MATRIIPAGFEHLDELVRLFNSYRVFYGCPSDEAAARAFLTDRLTRDDSVVFLAIDDSLTPARGIGFTQLYPSFSSVSMKRIWILNDLFVDESGRRSGVGKMLLTAATEFAAESDAARLELATEKENFAAKGLYESNGWRINSVFDHYSFAIE